AGGARAARGRGSRRARPRGARGAPAPRGGRADGRPRGGRRGRRGGEPRRAVARAARPARSELMDIWRSVNEVGEELAESGRVRLAELIDKIPGYVVNHEHAHLDAAVPEALALAREAKNPWLEVFLRHWNLQSRILHRHEIAAFLPE